MAGPDISVVIPVFNGQRFLAPTLHAVLAQQGVALELIVVDDGSTDGSPATVRRVAPQARLIEQRNAGVCAARNRGLAEARGRAVIFLDQDDIWHPLMLARELAVLDADPERVAAVCPYHHWRPGSVVGGESGAYPDPASVWGAERPCELDPDFTGWVYHQFLFDCWALTSATLLRRDAVQALGGFDVNLPFSEDWDLWLRLSRRGTFALLNWPSVLYRHHAVQGSREVRDRDWRVELLKKNAAEHGLASRDGRAMDPTRFQELLARYEAAFGYHHLAHGDRDRGARAMLAAWRRRPLHLARLAKGLAGLAGWRPG
jgi:glycosyltransferase involved in cell wall biosynthesis